MKVQKPERKSFSMINVVIYNENVHEKEIPRVTEIYPGGIHGYLKSVIEDDEINVTTVTLDMENCGISKELLEKTDVMLWWGHCYHDDVPDEVCDMVCDAVLKGMGIIFLHSAHKSKPFMKLMGTSGNLKWRDNDKEILYCINPNHPIAKDIPERIFLPCEEMYGEFFDIPDPDEIIFLGWFAGGDVFRSGCTWRRGYGKVFYFQPGHETNESYRNKDIQKIIKNAVLWTKSEKKIEKLFCPNEVDLPINQF